MLASLVILSHSPELVDGDRSREILTRVFGTLSFGEFAVNGFFCISGYLITASFERSASGFDYLVKRVLRIYPGYIVAFLLCVFVVGPLGGGAWAYSTDGFRDSVLAGVLLLQPPMSDGAFAGTPYPVTNGSAWTICYEFALYLVVFAFGSAGLLARRRLVLATVALVLCLSPLVLGSAWLEHAIGRPGWFPMLRPAVRFAGPFGCGALFYLYRDRIAFSPAVALVAALLLATAMCFHRTAQLAQATLGGYLLFYLAFHWRNRRVASIGTRYDLSYGTYLYAWPIQKLLIWARPDISPWLLFVAALPASMCCAWLSWIAIEKPAMRWSDFTKRGPDMPDKELCR